MRILFIGDIVGDVGCEYLEKTLPKVKSDLKIDTVIANGENSAQGNGINPASARRILAAGVDAITTGNHAYRQQSMSDMFEESEVIIRPYNYGEDNLGKGICYLDYGRYRICIINMMGTMQMEPLDNPFVEMDKILEKVDTPNIIVDFHAETTSEKRAMGFYLAGRVSAVLGTHTHVQTADEQILSDHTGYITDAGMTGPIESILGVKKEIIINRFLTHYPKRFENADGPCMMNCIVLDIVENTGKCSEISRYKF